MNEKTRFILYEWKNKSRIRYNYRMNQITNTFFDKEYRPKYSRYCGKEVLEAGKADLLLTELIESGNPFWVGRFGHSEMNFISHALQNRYSINDGQLEKAFYGLCNNAGFFPEDMSLGERYVDLILHCCGEIDAHAMWPLYMEDYIISTYEKNVKLFWYGNLEPWGSEIYESGNMPWSHALKGKKVLVIHPFADTIRTQYCEKRERIFEKRYPVADHILPEFELKTLKAVQTMAGNRDKRFDTWFEALNWMTEECKKIDFDVAILGCGAYGFPLAAEIKAMGKGAIQLCGATQLMFGIMGKRWINNATIKKLYNEAWVYPGQSERISDMEKVEGGCYW